MVLLMDAKSLGDSAVTVIDGETEKDNECEAEALAEGAMRLSVLEIVALFFDPDTSELDERVPLCETEREREAELVALIDNECDSVDDFVADTVVEKDPLPCERLTTLDIEREDNFVGVGVRTGDVELEAVDEESLVYEDDIESETEVD
jgi:hypothetical protein